MNEKYNDVYSSLLTQQLLFRVRAQVLPHTFVLYVLLANTEPYSEAVLTQDGANQCARYHEDEQAGSNDNHTNDS